VSARKVGIGIIGYGIGRVHAHAWLNIPLFYDPPPAIPRLHALCGRNSTKVAEAAKLFGFEKTHSRWSDLVKDTAVEILDDCAPPNLHAEPCIAAAEQGKAIICEKPLARTADEAYSIYKAAEKSGARGMTGFTYRFAPAVRLAKDLIDSGRLGRIFNMRCSYLNIESGNGGYLDPDYPLHWHFDKSKAGHGALTDLGSHALDMATFLLGDVVAVCGASQTFVKERPLQEDPLKKAPVTVDDVTVACLKLKSGALAVLDASWMAAGRKDFFYFEVNGSQGSVRFNLERVNELEVYLRDDPQVEGFRKVMVTSAKHPYMDRFWVDQGGGFTWNHMFVVELKHLLDCVVNDRNIEPAGATLRDGYINSLLIDSIAESNRTRGWITIEPKP
jgi:predicted dehydrogenase